MTSNESVHVRARRHPLLISALLILSSSDAQAGVEELTRKFAESDFVFTRARNDVPFVPLAWADATSYQESQFLTPSGTPSGISFGQKTISEGTLVPLPLGRRDALIAGQWMSWTRFDLSNDARKEVLSVGLPLGWIRQTNPNWQVAGFIAPLGHTSHGDGWYWEYLGGVFTRWLQNDRFAWVFGAYADVSAVEDFYIPYAGVTWTVSQHVTVSAIMPWPALLYSPTPQWLLRMGVSPSESSWSIQGTSANEAVKRPRINFSSWNFGFSTEREAWNNVWIGGEIGVSGFRGFSFVGSEWEGPNTDLGTAGYFLLTINFRPSLPK